MTRSCKSSHVPFRCSSHFFSRQTPSSIRPLSTLDLKKRRLSGRDQILSGGEHLIDGVPFGRHRLKVYRGRPAVHIAPRKRRRLNYDQDRDADKFDDYFNEDEDLDVYTGSRPPHQDDKEEGERLLLTQYGNKPNVRRVRFPASATSGVESTESEGSADEESAADNENEEDDDDDQENTFNPDLQELADELKDLRALAEEEARDQSPSEVDGHERFHTPSENVREHAEEQDVSSLGDKDLITPRTRSARQTRSHSLASQKSTAGRGSRGLDAMESKVTAHPPTSSFDSSLLDKITAIRSAFPQVSSRDCQKLLIKHGKDVSKTWRTLEKSLTPRQGLAETMVLNTQLELPREVRIVSSPVRELAGHLGEVSRIDEDEESNSSSGEEDGSDASASSSDEKDDSDESGNDSSSEATPTRLSTRAKKVVQDGSEDSSEDSSSDSDSGSQSEDDDHCPQQDTKEERCGQKPVREVDSLHSSSEESSSSNSSSDSEAPAIRRANARPNRQLVIQSSQTSPASSKAAKASSKEASARTEKDLFALNKTATVEDPRYSSDLEMDHCEAQSGRPTAEAATMPSTRATSKAASQTKLDLIPASQASTQQSVPPGQGKTRTQRRNQRRRLENQRKKAALEAASSDYHQSQDSAMSEMLMAKKNALLQTLGSQSQVVSEGASDASPPVQKFPKSTDTLSKGPDDWKLKISYRAVECVQKDIVDISEPPFPFYQRWDPQLRQDSQSTSKRRNKRKARDSSQFYDSSSQPSHKKRREDEHSRQIIDEYSYQDETTTFLTNQDDVTLNYDVTFNPDDDQPPVKKIEYADDLPQIPEHISSLPELLLKDLAAGAIVAWKQLLCTEATNWQPQLSEYMTAVVIEADIVKGHLQVQLAKRDRDVGKNEKKFDEETGQRIYGKFEVPDEDEEEEEDQGFRDLVLSQMMHARLLMSAVQPYKDQATGDAEDCHVPGEGKNGDDPDQVPQLPELGFEVADSQPRRNSHGVSGTSGSDQNQSRTLDHGTQSRKDQQAPNESQDMDADDDASPSGAIDESFIAETNHDIQMGEEEDDPAVSVPVIGELSISDERREEISQLMKAEGFRQEVRSSIDQSSFLRLGSPSRQLEEEYASSLHHKASSRAASTREASSEAPSEYGSKDPSQQMNQQFMEVDADAFHSAPQTPRIQHPSSDGPEDQQTRKIRPSTERMESSQVTEVSAQSGRQPDDNFIAHSDDLGVEPPTESPGVVTFDDVDDEVMGDLNTPNGPAVQAQTPTQQVLNDDLQTVSATKAAASRSSLQGPVSSPLGSVSSSASTESFPDIEVLWARMATKKFKESPIQVKNEPSSQVHMPPSGEDLPQPVPAAIPQRDIKEEFRSSPAQSTRSSKKGKGNDSTNSTPKAKSKVTTFDASVSPPALSKLRQKSKPSPSPESASKKVRNPKGKGNKPSGPAFSIPEGSQVVSLMTSSPEPQPEPEDEPEYTELYAEDSLDEDYHGDSFNSQQASQKKTRWSSKSSSRAKRGASVPVAESKESTINTNWVPGSQGPSCKASGRFGGRWSIGL